MFEIDPNKPGSSRFWKLRNDARVAEVATRWPLPRIGGRDPIATPVPDDPRFGVEVSYGGYDFGGELFVPVSAVQGGEVAFACETVTGYAVTIDHGAWCTYYAHLSKMFVTQNLRRRARLQRVKPGEVIGYAAKRPLHIRFEVWNRTLTEGWKATDALAEIGSWRIDCPENDLRTPEAA
jgi:murein DD-endopeptidase MepM/ murein hydrolase activator NlpD